MTLPTSLDLVLAAILAWVALGALGLVRPTHLRFVSAVLFPLGALVGLLLAAAALGAITAGPQARVLPLGLPDLPFVREWLSDRHLRLTAAVADGRPRLEVTLTPRSAGANPPAARAKL